MALVLALALAGVSASVHKGKPGFDAFYTPPPIRRSTPGALLRTQDFTRSIPSGAHAWRILYTTSDANGQAATASALVVVSDSAPATPRPVVAWAHGATGVVRPCAPSLLKDPAAAMPALSQILAQGWVLVATDYTGLGTSGPHPFLVGAGQAHSVLDAVRAARHVAGLQLSGQTVVWGHAQGGNAALWTGQAGGQYAPDVPLAGVAALAPLSDLPQVARNLGRVPGGAVVAAYLMTTYSAVYPDVGFDAYVRPGARAGGAARSRALPRRRGTVHVRGIVGQARPDDLRHRPGLGSAAHPAGREHPAGRHRRPGVHRSGPERRAGPARDPEDVVDRRCHLRVTDLWISAPTAGIDHLGVVAPDRRP